MEHTLKRTCESRKIALWDQLSPFTLMRVPGAKFRTAGLHSKHLCPLGHLANPKGQVW